jgi:hypothetical protein
MNKEEAFPIITKVRVAIAIVALVYVAFIIYLRLIGLISEDIFIIALLCATGFGILASVLIGRQEKGKRLKQASQPNIAVAETR